MHNSKNFILKQNLIIGNNFSQIGYLFIFIIKTKNNEQQIFTFNEGYPAFDYANSYGRN